MRMRTKKHLAARMERCVDLQITDPEEVQGRWAEVFGNDNPIYLEIGCGKGAFVKQNAEKFPDINFVAMEKDKNVIISAMESIKSSEIKNVKFICDNADIIDEFLEENECQRIYINFSDPLPKHGYRKKRLTHERYLSMYKKILEPGAEIHQKTDNKNLFEFSLNSFLDNDFLLKNVSLNVHDGDCSENIMTEYEAKFVKMGMQIYSLVAVNAPPELEPEL